MQQEDKWMKNFRERMKDYSEPLPDDLWQEIQQDLKAEEVKVIPFWKRWQMAAAVALVLVVSSLSVWFWTSSPVNGTREYVVETEQALESYQEEEIVHPVEEIVKKQEPVVTEIIKKRKANEVVAPKEVIEDATEERLSETIETEDSETIVKDSAQDSKEEVKGTKVKETPARQNYPAKPSQGLMAKKGKKRDASWSVGLSAGNLMASAKGEGSGRMLMGDALPGRPNYYLEFMDPIADEYASNSDEEVLPARSGELFRTKTADYKHRAPVALGLSVRWSMNDDWALESGLTYTRLVSDVNVGYSKGEQKLHYVGVPLKVNRRLWNNRWLEVYGSAGGMLEKCISGSQKLTQKLSKDISKEEETDLKVHELQASLNAALGVQLKLNGRVGIYAEPSVVYYFEDGSEVETIRKEHPLNLNFQVGLRFTFQK